MAVSMLTGVAGRSMLISLYQLVGRVAAPTSFRRAAGASHSLHMTAATHGPDNGPRGTPPVEKLRALPFTVARETAQQAALEHHRRNLLMSQPTSRIAKETFLPFWVTNAQVVSADVGHRRLVSTFDSRGRQSTHYETTWQRVTLGWAWDRAYLPTDPIMQQYASYKYPRSQMQRLLPGPRIYAATQITPELLQSSDADKTRRVGPFQVTPDAARHLALAAIRAKEMEAADNQLRKMFQADEVRFIDLRLEPEAFSIHPVYVPAHVFSSWYYGVKLRTFVSGVDPGAVAGTHVYDREKVGLLTGFLGLGAATASGALSPNPSLWVYWFSASAAAGWLLALVHPLMAHQLFGASNRMRRWWHQQRASRKSSESGGSESGSAEWDAEWMHEYDHLAGEQQRQERRSRGWQRSYEDSSGGGSGGGMGGSDPLGYYAALGVEPTCSMEELQAAFRGMALRHHPDRHQGVAQKAAASRRFQQITGAYQVLRNPAKRQQYDRGQTMQ